MFIKIPAHPAITVQKDLNRAIKDTVKSNIWINLKSILKIEFSEIEKEKVVQIEYDQIERPSQAFFFSEEAFGEFNHLQQLISKN